MVKRSPAKPKLDLKYGQLDSETSSWCTDNHTYPLQEPEAMLVSTVKVKQTEISCPLGELNFDGVCKYINLVTKLSS